MKHIDEQTQKIRAIPPKKRSEKLRDSAIGLGAIAVGFVLVKYFPELPGCSYVFYALLLFGAWSISGELLRSFLGYVPAAIREIRDAIKGAGG